MPGPCSRPSWRISRRSGTSPTKTKFHALAFDLVRSRVVLFGGDPGNGNALGDTWSWDGSTWTQTSNFGANPCMRAAMVSTDVQIAMFGGACVDIATRAR